MLRIVSLLLHRQNSTLAIFLINIITIPMTGPKTSGVLSQNISLSSCLNSYDVLNVASYWTILRCRDR